MFVLLFSLPAFAESFANRDAWLKDLGPSLKKAVCSTGSHFRKCFSPTNDECNSLADKTFTFCTGRYKIPKELTEEEFNSWQLKIKACVGTSMSIALEDGKKSVDAPGCTPEGADEAKDRAAVTAIPVDVYLEQLALSMPQDLCLENMPHRTCYKITTAECRAGITKAIQQCIPFLKKELPAKIFLSENRDHDMKVVGCFAPFFEQAFGAKRDKKETFCNSTFNGMAPTKGKGK